MIIEKQVKETAQAYCDATYGSLSTDPFIAEGFKQGAKWAINEFFKDLWHPASEEPDDNSIVIIFLDKKCKDWKHKARIWEVVNWCYFYDILPRKEEGSDE